MLSVLGGYAAVGKSRAATYTTQAWFTVWSKGMMDLDCPMPFLAAVKQFSSEGLTENVDRVWWRCGASDPAVRGSLIPTHLIWSL